VLSLRWSVRIMGQKGNLCTHIILLLVCDSAYDIKNIIYFVKLLNSYYRYYPGIQLPHKVETLKENNTNNLSKLDKISRNSLL